MAASLSPGWTPDLAGRIAASGFLVSSGTVVFTLPQLHTLSKQLPALSARGLCGVYTRAIGFQTAAKSSQYVLVRLLKEAADGVSPGTPALNTMCSFAIPGTFLQAAMYNRFISDTYQHYGLTPAAAGWPGLREFLHRKVAPGCVWSFLREAGSTGGGLVLGPMVRRELQKLPGATMYPRTTRFAGGVLAGCFTALCTQWLHNTCLVAGGMAELGDRPSADLFS